MGRTFTSRPAGHPNEVVTRRSPGVRQTQAMGTGNLGFILRHQARDCGPEQQLRELTQNGIEAITARGGTGNVIWRPDPHHLAEHGVEKLSVTDDGIGMSADELVELLNNYAASSHRQALDANYGIGAKAAALPFNPRGLVYKTWRDGHGSMIVLHIDPRTGTPGLKPFGPNGEYLLEGEPVDVYKPDEISGSGTVVTLLGSSARQNTCKPPQGLSRIRWVTHHLNSRYFELPETVNLRVYERESGERLGGRGIEGAGRFLRRMSTHRGIVRLSDARVHWFMLKPETINQPLHLASGHFGILWQGELHDTFTGKSGHTRLTEAGVILGQQRVVMYVEPDGDGEYHSDLVRGRVLYRGKTLDEAGRTAAWFEEFRELIPPALKRMMDDEIARGAGARQMDISSRIAEIAELYSSPRYRAIRHGSPLALGDSPIGSISGGEDAHMNLAEGLLTPGGGETEPAGGSDAHGPGPEAETEAPASGSERLLQPEDRRPARPARQVRTLADLPECVFITAEQTPDLEDKAARYVPHLNQLQINRQFRVFSATTDFVCKRYGITEPAQRALVHAKVLDYQKLKLSETVITLRGLEGSSRFWSDEQVAQALSEESLTAAVSAARMIELDKISDYVVHHIAPHNSKKRRRSRSKT